MMNKLNRTPVPLTKSEAEELSVYYPTVTPGKPPENTELMTIREVATLCRFKRTGAIRNAIKNGELARVYFCHRHQLVPKADVLRWIESRTKKMRGRNYFG
jgi:hypothetical protein